MTAASSATRGLLQKLTLVRLYLSSLIVCAGVWIWTAVELHLQEKEDQEFYDQQVAPELERVRAPVRTSPKVEPHGSKNAIAPMERLELPRIDIIQEHLERNSHRADLRFRQANALIAGMACTAIFTLGTLIQAARRKRQWEAPERPAVTQVSPELIQLVESNGRFVAKGGGKSPRTQEVEIDAARMTVIFRHFAFVDSFARNPVRETTELPFSELLVGTIDSGQRAGHLQLSLRTTQGRVFIPDSVEPFSHLASHLIGLAELNRGNTVTYREALSREPVIRTPWWGWLILAAGIGFIAWLCWLALYG